MDINSAFNSSLAALHRAEAGLKRNAETIARHSGHIEGSEDIHTALVQARQHQTQAEIAVKVVSTTDEIVGTLIDTVA